MNDPFIDVLDSVTVVLDRLQIPYAITGSMASAVHGEPLMSQDVDVCVRMTGEQAAALTAALPQRFYRSEEAMTAAARGATMSNLVDMATGLKVGLSVLKPDAYYDSVMQRRQRVSFGAGQPPFWFVTPEDVILMKLQWRRESRSQKQWNNCLSVVRNQGPRLDWGYLRAWAVYLDVEADLEELARQAGV